MVSCHYAIKHDPPACEYIPELGDDNFVPRCTYKHGAKRCWNAGEFAGYCAEHTKM